MIPQKTSVNVYHYKANNIGDLKCGPEQYFDFPSMFPATFKDDISDCDNIIIGGGGVFAQAKHVADNIKCLKRNLIAWGIGLPPRSARDSVVLKTAQNFTLFSTRSFEWRDTFRFVPCVSCMDSVFNTKYTVKHDVAVFSHRKKTPILKMQTDFPQMDNSEQNFIEVIKFIASTDILVTSSFHGVYWGQLLGKKIVCIPYNHKFASFEQVPTIATEADWQENIHKARRHSSQLDEYRSLNRKYYEDVMAQWIS